MNKRIDNVLKRTPNLLNEWEVTFQKYIQLYFCDSDIADEKHFEILQNTSDLFSQLLQIFIEYGRYQDNFQFNDFFPNVCGVESIVKSGKLDCEFMFGTSENAFYLQSYLLYPEYIYRMDDLFWRNLLELNHYGKFKFVENAWVQGADKSDIERIFKNTKSNLIHLLKNYILLNIHNGDLTDIGWLRVEWPINTNLEDLIVKGCESFKILYKINYSLWKIQYRRSKR